MKRAILSLHFIILCFLLFAQKHDYVWLTGYDSHSSIPELGGTVINFNYDPLMVDYDDRPMDLNATVASICDAGGNLLFYTNGIYIANYLHDAIPGSDSLNPGGILNDFYYFGYPLPQGAVILPHPESDNLFYLFHETTEYGSDSMASHVSGLYYTIVNMNINEGLGGIEEKRVPVLNIPLSKGKFTTCKHANGRDWWLLVRQYQKNIYHRILFTPDGVFNIGNQEIGIPDEPLEGLGQAVFSPNGEKYVRYTTTGLAGESYLDIFDFDRCTGLLSNPVQTNFVDSASAAGAAISQNSRFLYASSNLYIYQYDLEAADILATKDTIAIYDGYTSPFSTRFFLAQLAPDEKIYINTPNGTDVMHIIHQPDLPGAACEVEQHGLQLPTFNAISMPNFPYYRLGPLAGSPCDTLAAYYQPQAGFIYDTILLTATFIDTTLNNPFEWYWDFGDNASSTAQFPAHTYAEAGTYEVCLTATNFYGSDMVCQMVTVQSPVGLEEVEREKGIVRIFPNPAQSELHLQFSQPLKKQGTFSLYNALGQVVFQRALSFGQSVYAFDLRAVSEGMYFYKVSWDGCIFKEGRLVIAR